MVTVNMLKQKRQIKQYLLFLNQQNSYILKAIRLKPSTFLASEHQRLKEEYSYSHSQGHTNGAKSKKG